MTTIPPRNHHHKPLHNFSLPFLNWGQKPSNRRHRFPTTSDAADVTVTPKTRHADVPTRKKSHHKRPHHDHVTRKTTSSADVSKRSKTHLHDDGTNRRNHHKSFSDDDVIVRTESDNLVDVDVAAAVEVEMKPWKLRPRKSVTKGNGEGNGGGGAEGERSSGRLLRTVEVVAAAEVVAVAEEEDREAMMKRRLWISLSKDEIERDILMFTGAKPVRRPKKRNRIAQKHLDNCFPGLYLVGMSADSYRL